MAKAVTIYRNSADDRKGPAKASPFRAKDESTRVKAAEEMIAKRRNELDGLQEILRKTTDKKTQRILAQRILATANNLKSWESYLDGSNERDEEAYREKRAVVIPPKRARAVARKTRRAA